MLCESEEKTLHKSDEKYQAYVKILEEELVPAMGCTEPIAIAYAQHHKLKIRYYTFILSC